MEEGGLRAASSLQALRDYSQRLGEEQAARVMAELGGEYDAMRASPVQAKRAVSASYVLQRSTRKFDG
jgi:hypothetical protein